MDLFEKGMFVKTPAWHEKGIVVPNWASSFAEASELAGLDWDVYSTAIPGIPGWAAIRRSDTEEPIWVAPDTYTPVTHRMFGEVVDEVLRVEVGSGIDALTVLDGGRSITATVFLPEPLKVPGDDSQLWPYYNLSDRHDQKGGLRTGPGLIRVVCANTQRVAESQMDVSSLGRVFRHTKGITAHWDSVKEAISNDLRFARQVMNDFNETAQILAVEPFGKEKVKQFKHRWLPVTTSMSPRSRTYTESLLKSFDDAYSTSETRVGNDSAWAVYQAVQEADQHSFPSRSREGLVRRQWAGGSDYAARGSKVLLDMVGLSSRRLAAPTSL